MDAITPSSRISASSDAALPLAIARWADAAGTSVTAVAVRDHAALDRIAAALPVFAPESTILRLPAWDSLPYDRGRPSRAVTGQRIGTLAWLADPDRAERRAIVVTTPEALLQRVPPPSRVQERAVPLAFGQDLDPAWLHDTLLGFGYVFDDRVDEPGEAAIRGGTVDVHLAGESAPIRLELAEGRIAEIRRYDPLTQRSSETIQRALLLPTTEAFTVPGEALPARGRERLLPDGPLATLFDYLPGAALALTEGAEERFGTWLALVRDAWQVASAAMRAGAPPPDPPDRLFMTEAELHAALQAHRPAAIVEPEDGGLPTLAATALVLRVGALQAEHQAVVIATAGAPDRVAPALARRMGVGPETLVHLPDWTAAEALAPGAIGLLPARFAAGFADDDRTVLVLRPPEATRPDEAALDRPAGTLRIGDLVVEPSRGLARLTGLVMEEQAGAPIECLRLAFLGGTNLLLPAAEADRIWRYGASSTLKPNRLDSEAWQAQRADVERDIAQVARGLVARMKERAKLVAPKLESTPPYARFVRRMPFAPTADQVRAIRAVQHDLASGRPMLRLLCGDVGFGKTEVALHAAALAAFAGKQVAVVAPTTLLAGQHLDTFRRRLSGTGLRIEGLIRSARSTEARAVLRDVAEGKVHILVGTHAVGSARFRDLGLVVIDEEQRFGEAQKQRLRTLQDRAHALVMTATPLPRSLQGALVGLVSVSLLATPPAARQSVRGFVAGFDPVVIRAALMHEARRGGQSFFVVPRIEDVAPMAAQLRELVPELAVTVVHGRMRGEVLDAAMLDFADGGADVLLATSIIEAGLDVPNANTMLIWRADRFGLAQLHQLRGRVGRGRARASAYLLTEPAHPPSASARKRLETIATLDSLGAGFAVSLADLDQRGAGDLLGDTQAGHVRLIGTDLYRDVLRRELARARGEDVPDPWRPDLVCDVPAFVPADFVPEADARLAIYRELARLETPAAVDEAAAELDDRFGDLPIQVRLLLDLARLRLACLRLGIARVQAGPAAVALTPRPGAGARLESLPGAM
ncbi:MAG: DEAD/DEAH box helicase, partial [Rhodospirillales bacterium]|nr:DEAD/DEAH box helicase [Rhodospirillales bacterium]